MNDMQFGQTPETSETERGEGKSAGRRLALCMVLLCIAIALFAGKKLVRPDKTVLTEAVELPALTIQPCEVYGDGVIYYDGTLLYALDGSGQQRWTYLAGANAGFAAKGAGVVSWTGAQIALLGPTKGETIFSVTLTDPVLAACPGNQFVAAVVGEDDMHARIVLLDRNGKQIDTIETSNSMVMDMGFFNNGTLFWCLMLETDGTVPTSHLCTYKPGKMQTGRIVEETEVIYKALFHATQLRAVGTTYAKAFDYTGREDTSARKLVYGWMLCDVDTSTEEPLMVFTSMDEAGSGRGMQDVRFVQGKLDKTGRFPYACKSIYARGGMAYGFTGDMVQVLQPRGGSAGLYRMPVQVDMVRGMTDDGKVLVISESKFYLVPLPKK